MKKYEDNIDEELNIEDLDLEDQDSVNDEYDPGKISPEDQY